MTDYPMRLRAHPNVIPIAEERERRRAIDDHAVRFVMCVPPGCFVGWSTEPADTPPKPPKKPRWGLGWFRRP
jgi:hypothetical protein